MIATIEDTIEFQTKDTTRNYNTSVFLLVDADVLKQEYRSFRHQVKINCGGFGCDPSLLGTAVFLKDPITGETGRYCRSDILGTPTEACVATFGMLYDPEGRYRKENGWDELPIPNFNNKEG